MNSTFSFTCKSCGEVHVGSPSFGYPEPLQYAELTDEEKREIASLSQDFCEIRHTDQTDHFIRVILEVPIHGAAEPFLWGIWISVSASNFKKYRENFRDPQYEADYFGWFSNTLPYYPATSSLKTSARVRPGGQRPRISLEPTDHPLAVDARDGISWEKAIEIAERVMHGTH